MKVLITTSGVGSRLGELTEYTNKALIRVGKKPAISYIIESYPDDAEFVVSVGYFGQHIKEFLPLAYPNHKFIFVDVDPYQGQGSSLGYSMLCCKQHLQCPFIFNACDTIIDEKIAGIDSNWIAGCNKGSSAQYRTFSVLNNKVNNIHDKGEKNYDYEYIGVCSVRDYSTFWTVLEQIYNSNTMDTTLSDCDVLKAQIKINNFGYKIFGWLDIGNFDALTDAREQIADKFELLDKNDESIFIFENSVIKFFNNSSICNNRVKRAQILGDCIPEILGCTEHFYKYKFVDGELFADVANKNNFSLLLDYACKNLWIPSPEKPYEFYATCKRFYFDKTIDRVNAFHIANNIKDEVHTINGLTVPSISDMLNLIDESWLCDVHPTGFHGDFILDNMIIKDDVITLLDWRHDFGGNIDYGDMYYDLGKLNHNLIVNHSVVSNSGFWVQQIDDNSFKVDILRKHSLVECQNVLFESSIDAKKVRVLSALIWLNMSPLHDKNLGLFLYLFGKYMLFKELNA